MFGRKRQMVAAAMRAPLAQLRPAQPQTAQLQPARLSGPQLRLARLRLAVSMLLPLALAACGGGSRLASSSSGYGRFYTAPGPASDPWRPYIREASTRFSVPQTWIRAVMRQESGGHEYLNGRPVTSDAGAMGLMQLMPATYAELRDRYGLGNDPYEPHDNIMAGTGYISELYARYGSPAFLAAYNAGPHRLDQYNAGTASLPDQTVAYLASVAPSLASDGPMTGPLAAYADAGGRARAPVQVYAASARPLGGCWRDPDAAYDPDDPCNRHTAPASAPVVVASRAGVTTTRAGNVIWADGASALAVPPRWPAPVPAPATKTAAGGCVRDLDAAYDPEHPCNGGARQGPVIVAAAPPAALPAPAALSAPGPAPGSGPAWGSGRAPGSRPAWGSGPAAAPARYAAAAHRNRFALISSAQAEPLPFRASPAGWGVQVGAFASAEFARQVAIAAQRVAARDLGPARIELKEAAPAGQLLFRSRLVGVSRPAADNACAMLTAHRWDCLTVPPGG